MYREKEQKNSYIVLVSSTKEQEERKGTYREKEGGEAARPTLRIMRPGAMQKKKWGLLS